MESCCTCAKLLSAVPRYDAAAAFEEKKPLPEDRRLGCCGRVDNARFSAYCPYCQISERGSSSSVLPPNLKDPPSYTSSIATKPREPPPPPYTASADDPPQPSPSAPEPKAQNPPSPPPRSEDTLHFLQLPDDTVASLSLRYGVSAAALRRANRLHSDHLLAGRRTVVIPGGGASLSPRPVEGEAGERRARALRRWMVRCKVADYDVALLYLGQAAYDLEAAVAAYLADEAWEREHPLEGEAARRGKEKKKKKGEERKEGGFGGRLGTFVRR
ncbi:hypothetical protein SLS62_006444 [Diatrype stigma]|uniref:LysM domain-containing protein n=1 Tax=Diatrype stigma TaxID=117547 RepID=A0AAN9UPT4_9PEZI